MPDYIICARKRQVCSHRCKSSALCLGFQLNSTAHSRITLNASTIVAILLIKLYSMSHSTFSWHMSRQLRMHHVACYIALYATVCIQMHCPFPLKMLCNFPHNISTTSEVQLQIPISLVEPRFNFCLHLLS